MKAKEKSEKNGIDLSNLFAIAAAASENKISGSLEFDFIGISGPITPLVPVPSSLSIESISAESISASIQALAAIKAKTNTDGDFVYIWPQVTKTVGGEPNKNRQNLKATQ